MKFDGTRRKYQSLRAKAYQGAIDNLRDHIDSPFSVQSIGIVALEAWERDWVPILDASRRELSWNWAEIFRRFDNEPGRLDIAIWEVRDDDRAQLCGLAMGQLKAHSVNLVGIEGNPSRSHPLRGDLIPIALETGTNYAQITGRSELRIVDPRGARLIHYYTNELGFKLVHPAFGVPYCVRKV